MADFLDILHSDHDDVTKYHRLHQLNLLGHELEQCIDQAPSGTWKIAFQVMLLEYNLNHGVFQVTNLISILTGHSLLINFNTINSNSGGALSNTKGVWSWTGAGASAPTSSATNSAASANTDLEPQDDGNSNSPELLMIIKFKANDLLTDYYHLVRANHTDYVSHGKYRIIELVNKKIILLNNFGSSNDKNNLLVQMIKVPLIHKISELLIVSGYDFRRQDLFNYINDNFLIPYEVTFQPETSRLFNMNLKNKELVTLPMLQEFLNNCNFRLLADLTLDVLVENLLEVNLNVMAKFYKSIYVSNILALLKLGDFKVDLLMVSKMIVSNNLPSSTKIDQINGLLIFPSQTINPFNDTLKLVDYISNKV